MYCCIFTLLCCLCAEGKRALTLIEENLSAVIMLPRTGYVKGRPVVAVMSLHESASIDHELNTVWVPCWRTQGKTVNVWIDSGHLEANKRPVRGRKTCKNKNENAPVLLSSKYRFEFVFPFYQCYLLSICTAIITVCGALGASTFLSHRHAASSVQCFFSLLLHLTNF